MLGVHEGDLEGISRDFGVGKAKKARFGFCTQPVAVYNRGNIHAVYKGLIRVP